MSAASKVVEGIFRLSGASKELPAKKFYKKLRRNAIRDKKGGKPLLFFNGRVESEIYCGMRYFVFVPREVETGKSVLYIHGSSYMNRYRVAQLSFAAGIARNTHAKVYFPLYPKLPITTVLPCVALLNNFYVFLRKKGEVFLLGDSSGASLSLALAAERADITSVIAISPWLKLSLGEECRDIDTDVMLCPSTLQRVARLWAYDLPFENVKLSPYFGDYSGKELFLFAGEKELFRPDILSFCREKEKEGAKISYREGREQPHCYPLLPTPEGREARKEIYRKLQNELYGE